LTLHSVILCPGLLLTFLRSGLFCNLFRQGRRVPLFALLRRQPIFLRVVSILGLREAIKKKLNLYPGIPLLALLRRQTILLRVVGMLRLGRTQREHRAQGGVGTRMQAAHFSGTRGRVARASVKVAECRTTLSAEQLSSCDSRRVGLATLSSCPQRSRPATPRSFPLSIPVDSAHAQSVVSAKPSRCLASAGRQRAGCQRRAALQKGRWRG
jgi:hypothetical protein